MIRSSPSRRPRSLVVTALLVTAGAALVILAARAVWGLTQPGDGSPWSRAWSQLADGLWLDLLLIAGVALTLRLTVIGPLRRLESYTRTIGLNESVEAATAVPSLNREFERLRIAVDDLLRHRDDTIADLRRSETALRESDARYRALVENTPDVIARFGRDCRFTFLNNAARNAGTLAPEDLIGRTPTEAVQGESSAQLEALIRRVVDTGLPASAELALDRGGVTRVADVRAFPEFEGSGRVASVIAIERDISDRKRAEEAIEERLRFERVLSSLSGSFLKAGAADLERVMVDGLGHVGEFLGVDMVDVQMRQLSEAGRSAWHYWRNANGLDPQPHDADRDYPWITQCARRGDPVMLSRMSDLPPAAAVDRQNLMRYGIKSMLIVPAKVGGDTIVTMAALTTTQERSWSADELARVRLLAEVFASAFANRGAEERLRQSEIQLRALAARAVQSLEQERTTISRRVHDHLGQILTAIRMMVMSLARRIPADAADAQRQVREILDELDAGVDTVQAIATDLRPSMLDDLGLGPTIEAEGARFEQRTGVACRVRVPETPPVLSDACATALFRVYQQALTNVARHAHATAVDVVLSAEGRMAQLVVKDDGVGIAEHQVTDRRSIGLAGMREQVELVGGRIAFTGEPGQGTRVVISVPADPDGPGRPSGGQP